MPEAINNKILTLPDGRVMGYCEYGDPVGMPVIFCHGYPASRLQGALTQLVAKQIGLRIVSADRPGFGLSDPLPGRNLLDWPRDVAVLSDALGFERFAVLGVSGGGPYALACGYALATRVSKVSVICGLAPLSAKGILAHTNWLAWPSYFLARRAPLVLRIFHTLIILSILRPHPERLLRWIISRSVADRKILERKDILVQITASIQESLRQGMAGVTSEFQLYAHDWGFNLSKIQVPVHLWQGDRDTTVPLSHARYLAEILPNATLTVVPGEGHFSLPIVHMAAILRELV